MEGDGEMWEGIEMTRHRCLIFLYFFPFSLPAGIDSIISGMSQDLAARRSRNYRKFYVRDWPPKSNLLPASVIW